MRETPPADEAGFRSAVSEVLSFLKKKELACLSPEKNPAGYVPWKVLPEAAKTTILQQKKTIQAGLSEVAKRATDTEQEGGGVGR